ncbi:polymer-forming cytoskeletal family protein [Marinomonas rhizomae]|uniref:bactofilin family protein n=1 Tax=Marinomonas rhizomae TaxID=491948 RepID=UPI000DE94161|nr:polymer-forming cytoskeletal protein [Marinomonas rhizomae]RNF71755.1 polymer-forming cytoskeletal family protein [Marinomonas rhizomae]
MGIFGGKNRIKSQSATTTLIAEGCTINGHINVDSHLQIDGNVEGQIEAKNQIKISTSGSVQGEITTERLIINGNFEGICHATYIEILSYGRVSGTVYSDNLSIEPGGKFMGVTHSSDQGEENQRDLDDLDGLNHQEEKVVLINNDKNT